jgi:hypothetical protein
LIRNDPNTPVDLDIQLTPSLFSFRNRGRTVFDISPKAFFAQPEEALRRFSRETDRYALFRQITIVCLLVGFPVLLYILVFSLFRLIIQFTAPPKKVDLITAMLCFFLGLALLIPLLPGRTRTSDAEALSAALRSESWKQRVIALRNIATEKRHRKDLSKDDFFLTSTHLPERYWYAKALAWNRDPETHDHLIRLLDDSHPNVVSMAYYSLGQRKDRRAVHEILSRIASSRHWYNQWYAYRALRSLGWKQPYTP